MPGPLAGIRVIEVAIAVLGPLADADPRRYGRRNHQGRNARGRPDAADRSCPQSRHGRVFSDAEPQQEKPRARPEAEGGTRGHLRLAKTADVFVHNMRTGAAARLGIDYTTIAAANPGIVYASATGYRPGTRYEDRAAFDDVIQGESGLAALNGGSGGAPRYVPMVVCDKVSGHVLAGADCDGAIRPRAHRQGSGNPRADDGDDGRLQPRRSFLARRIRRAGKRSRLSAHADPVPPSLCHRRRAYLPAGDDRPAMAGPVRGDGLPRTRRGPTLCDDRRADRKYRRAVYDRRRAHAAAHDARNGASGSTGSTCRTGSSTISPASSPIRI